MQLGPDVGTGFEGQQPDRFAAVAQRHHEQPGTPVLARLGVPHHRAGPVVDLGFFPRSSLDDACSLGALRSAELAHEAFNRLVAIGEAVIRHQVLPDRHPIAASTQVPLDDLPVGFAPTARGGDRFSQFRDGPILGPRVGGHLYGRFCRWPFTPTTGPPHRDTRAPQVCPCRFPTDTGRLLDPP